MICKKKKHCTVTIDISCTTDMNSLCNLCFNVGCIDVCKDPILKLNGQAIKAGEWCLHVPYLGTEIVCCKDFLIGNWLEFDISNFNKSFIFKNAYITDPDGDVVDFEIQDGNVTRTVSCFNFQTILTKSCC